ncbi:hypothetical protein J4409_03065 [Candidatus Woesearchaeota archaeon]|nr:hypothetical protein [Candidatus Woesearchaeota archaeon]
MHKYKCSECSYTFSRSFEYKGKCPYCGKNTIRQDFSSEKIVKEVDNFWVKKIS